MEAADSSPPTEEVSRVAARLPPFWAERPALLFAQAEAQFLAGISSEKTKFCHVISQLDQRYDAELEDIITSSQTRPLHRAEDRADETAVPLETTTHAPVSFTRNYKPSQFLRHLRNLAPRRARRPPPHHLVQPATPQHSSHSCRPMRGQLGRRSPLRGSHLRGFVSAGASERWSKPDSTALLQGI
jgi:hypothetical protein